MRCGFPLIMKHFLSEIAGFSQQSVSQTHLPGKGSPKRTVSRTDEKFSLHRKAKRAIMGRYKEEDRGMDIKDQVTKAVDKIMKDKELQEQFEKEPWIP